jgi:hypothetical protein
MTATIEKSGVVFTEDGAIYRPGNGHVIQYRKVGSIYYHVDTPDAVVRALEQARSTRRRIRIYLGDSQTGRDWLEEHDVSGYVGNSLGPLKVPLLVFNRRSFGGGAILDHCVIKIKWTTGGVLHQHAQYHTGTFTIGDIRLGDRLWDSGFTHHVNVNGQNHANFRSRQAAERYVRKMTA